MAETCEMWDTLVSNSDLAKRQAWQGPGPPKYLLCPTTQFAKDWDALIEQSNILLKQSVNIIYYVNNMYTVVTPALWYHHWHNRIKKK